jgi:hypothetical protein
VCGPSGSPAAVTGARMPQTSHLMIQLPAPAPGIRARPRRTVAPPMPRTACPLDSADRADAARRPLAERVCNQRHLSPPMEQLRQCGGCRGRWADIHPASVEDGLRPVAAYWVENDSNKINAIPQIARLAPVEDRLGDIRGEIAEADDPSEVRPADAFALGKRGKGNAVSAEECRVEPACSGHQLAAAGCPRDDEERPRQQGRIVLIQRAREDLEADVDPAAGETRPARAAWPLVAKSASVKSATPCG